MSIQWDTFYTCLSPAEKDVVAYMASFSATPDPMVYKWAYDAVWDSLISPVRDQFYVYWMNTFGLSIQDVDLPLIGVTTMVVWTFSEHLALNLFLTDPDFDHEAECPYTSGYFALPYS